MKAQKRKTTKRRGPEADTLKLSGDWTGAVKKALTKSKPNTGWPKAKEHKNTQ